MTSQKRRPTGFSLLEAMGAVGLLGIIMVGMLSVSNLQNRTGKTLDATDTEGQLTNYLNSIIRDEAAVYNTSVSQDNWNASGNNPSPYGPPYIASCVQGYFSPSSYKSASGQNGCRLVDAAGVPYGPLPINLYDNQNSKIISAAPGGTWFDLRGRSCTQGTPECIFQVKAFYQAACPFGTSCPQASTLTLSFTITPITQAGTGAILPSGGSYSSLIPLIGDANWLAKVGYVPSYLLPNLFAFSSIHQVANPVLVNTNDVHIGNTPVVTPVPSPYPNPFPTPPYAPTLAPADLWNINHDATSILGDLTVAGDLKMLALSTLGNPPVNNVSDIVTSSLTADTLKVQGGFPGSVGNPNSGSSIWGAGFASADQILVNPSHFAADPNPGVYSPVFFITSDARLKSKFAKLKKPLEKLLDLRGVSFRWKESGAGDLGFIAQEVEKVFPELVESDKDGFKSVRYANLVAVLIEAFKELRADHQRQLEEQTATIERLEALVSGLENRQPANAIDTAPGARGDHEK